MAVLGVLERAGLADLSIRHQVAKIRVPPARTVTATQDTVASLKAHASPWMRAFICLCVDCGLRFMEATNATNANYNAEQKTITFKTKGSRIHAMPVLTELSELIEGAEDTGGPTQTLLERIRGRSTHPKAIRKAWKKLKAAAGAPDNLRPHDLRRTMAANIYTRTHDLRITQQALGHASLTSTLHYLGAHDPNELRSLLNELTAPHRPATRVIQ